MALKDNLLDSAISLHLEADNSSDVIEHLGKKLLDAGLVKESFIQAAIKRESTLPTGLPLEDEINVAIPHTDIEHVLKPGIALATLAKPVVFQNMVDPTEAISVSLVFLMALDQPHAQIEMLQEIMGVIQDEELLQTLMKAEEVQDVKNALREIGK